MAEEIKNNIKVESLGLPGMGLGNAGTPKFNAEGYRVRYLKVDMDDLAAVYELEQIETRGISTDEVLILSKTSFSCMTSFFWIITYLEKKEGSEYKAPDVSNRAMPRAKNDVDLNDSSKFAKTPKIPGIGDEDLGVSYSV